MNPSVLFVFILSILLGVLRAADLAFGTDAVTGLCVVGSVWWRYLALGIVVLAAVLVGRTQPSRSEAVRSRRPLAGILAFVGAVCFLAAAGAQIALGAASGLGGFVRCILECLCSAWLSTMGRCWLSPNEWKKPFGGLYLAVAGSLLFYWNVLLRFMENSSSWHRVEPTAMVWQMLAALVFLSAMVRALWLPETSNGCQLCEAGICTFLLCFCWELPRVLVLLFHGIMAADLPEVLFGFGMCCIGALGLFTVARVAGSDGRPAIPRHAVG